MKTPFGRVGGKRFLSKYIISLFPDSYSTYVEPFFGAGSVFFKIKDYHKLGIGHFRLKELNREYFRIGFHNYQEEDSTRCIIWQKDPYKK